GVPLYEVGALSFSPDGKSLLVTSGIRPTSQHLYDVATWKAIKPPPPIPVGPNYNGKVALAGFAPDDKGRSLLQVIEGDSMVLRDPDTGKEAVRFTYRVGGVSPMSFTRDGKYAAGSSDWGDLRLWNAKTGKELYRYAEAR